MEDMIKQFIVALKEGGRIEWLNGKKLDKYSASQLDTISEIEDSCAVRGS